MTAEIARVLVCGGRDYTNETTVFDTLDALVVEHPERWALIHGGAPGADRLAEQWAAQRRRVTVEFRATWETHGRSAGPIRNQAMIEYDPDLVIAFPGGRGTADMIRRARLAGVAVRLVGSHR